MPDSPRCIPCLDSGLTGQTYKLAGQPIFKCSTCKTLYHKDRFKVEDYLWKDDPARWAVAYRDKKWSAKGKKRVDEVMTVEGRR